MADFNGVLAFVRVVDVGSFRGAAKELGLPKSNVSRKVQDLEDRLGARLLERTTRRLRLTEVGAAYYRQVAPAVSALQRAERTVDELQTEPRGQLRISVPVALGHLFFGALVAEYMRQYPALTIAVDLSDRAVNIIEEGFDLALRAGHLPDSSLVARRLGEARVQLFASPAYLQARGIPRHPTDLLQHHCLVYAATATPQSWAFQDRRRQLQVAVEPRAVANSFFVLRELALADQGIARMPGFIGARLAAEGRLRTVLEPFEPPPTPLSLLFPSARHLSPKVKSFVDFLSARFTPPPWDPLEATRGPAPAGVAPT